MFDCRKHNVELVRNLKNQYGHIYIFGAGNACKRLLNYIHEGGVSSTEIFSSILVSEMNDNPHVIDGLVVSRIGDVKITDHDLVVVAIYNNAEVMEQLQEYRNVIPFYNIIPIEDTAISEDVRKYIEYFERDMQCFKYIEIETINRCNGDCAFCPVNRNTKQRKYHKMSEELFKNIIDQLAEMDYQGMLGLFSNNEPFLDERIVRFAQYARARVSRALIYIYTNGKLLTLSKFKEIIPYLDTLLVDNYEINKGKPENILQIEQEIERQGISNKYVYNEVNKNAIRSTRGGNSPNSKVAYITECLCPLPFLQMIIRPDGKVSLCCNDALGENTLGDLREQSLMEIWNGDMYKKVRNAVKSGRHNLPTCRYCNNIDGRELWKPRQFKFSVNS